MSVLAMLGYAVCLNLAVLCLAGAKGVPEWRPGFFLAAVFFGAAAFGCWHLTLRMERLLP